MIVILFLVLISSILGLSCYYFYSDRKRIDLKGPPPYPLIGNGHLLAVNSSEFLAVLKRLEDEFNYTCLIYLFSQRYILTSDPKFVEEVVSSTKIIDKGKSYRFVKPWLGEGLLTSSGARWKAHRKFLTPAFHFNILQLFLPIFCKNAKILAKKFKKIADGSSFDLVPIVALATLDNVTESIMAVSVNAQNDEESDYVKSINNISSIISMRMRNPFVAPDWVFNMLPYKTVQDKALKVLNSQTDKVIRARREELLKINPDGKLSDIGIKNKHAFLDLLLLAEVDGKKISDECIREEVNTFMFEGHDTTMSGICYNLYCISLRNDVQEKLLDEQKSILGDDLGRDATYSELQQMKYLEMVIKESLRLFPSVPLIERGVLEDLEIDGKFIPKGTSIVIDFLNMQRNPNVFDDPLEFRPERFETYQKNPFTWLPFSAGPRNCIGQRFAMLEMKATIAEVIKNFKLLPAGETPQLGGDLILRSHNGVKVKLQPRV